ncbi:MAG: nuclear transport factor 2 family protein, partial [Bryobacterales bacterium]|nr:nuclear transport factor 2 family protein [Bryobacterales bacterium]
GDNIAVRLHETGVLKATGEGYEVRGVLWFTFEDMHVRRIDEFLGVVALSPQAASVVVS